MVRDTWVCPECGLGAKRPEVGCICNKPLHVYIRPGHHIHVKCPVHGDVVINGSEFIWGEDD